MKQVLSLAPIVESDLQKRVLSLDRELAPLGSQRWALRIALSHCIRIARLIVVNQTREVLTMEEVMDKKETIQGLCSTL